MKLNWFLRCVLMEEAGADGGVGGGGGTDSTALTVSTGTAVATEGGGDGTGGGDGSTALATTGADSQPIIEGGRLTQSASQTFRQLEKANPQAREVIARSQRALATVAKLTEMLGSKFFERINGLRRLEQEVAKHSYVGNDGKRVDGLTALRQAGEDIDRSDSLYEKADPQLIAMMTESAPGKHAFVKLFPHVVNRLHELAPKTYRRWMGMQNLHIVEKAPVTLKLQNGQESTEEIDIPFRLRRMIGNLPWAIDKDTGTYAGGAVTPQQAQALAWDFEMLHAFMTQVRATANETPEDLTPAKEDTTAAEIATAKREAETERQGAWATKRDAICNDVLGDEVRKQTKALDLSQTIIADITSRARKAINETRRAKPDNERRQKAFFDSGDLAGYLAYNRSILEDQAQSAVEKAVQLYGRKSSRRTPATQKTVTPAAPAPAGQQKTHQAAPANVVMLNAEQLKKLNGSSITRFMKTAIGNQPGTTNAMVVKREYMLKAANPWGYPEGTVVRVPMDFRG